jgi:hypothetical protein
MQACGYRSTEEVARILFTAQPGVTHLTINSRDAALFHATHGDNSRKLGNPFDPAPPVEKAEKCAAATWLRRVCGAAESTPIWLAPSRLIRRKNLLESLLQMHRLCPEAILVTGNCPTSREEQPYAEALRQIAANPAARFRLVDLNAQGAPGMAALHAGADVLVQSSLQEGFGLLFLEAASAGRPLVCRRLPNVWPDLAAQGLVFPDAYDECPVELPEAELTDERHRQQALFQMWKQGLPGPWQGFAPGNPLSHWFDGRPLPFSKLTLGAQLRILSREIAAPCGDGNSFSPTGSLQTGRIFSTSEYAGVFAGFLEGTPGKEANSDDAPCRLQDAIVRDATAPENIFPLLLDVPERKIS